MEKTASLLRRIIHQQEAIETGGWGLGEEAGSLQDCRWEASAIERAILGWKELCARVCDSKEGMSGQVSVGGQRRLLGYGACALAGSLWGTGFYWGRLALNEMSVEHMVLYRFLFACVGMAPVMLRRRVRLTAPEWRTVLLAAAFGIPIQFLLQFHGLALTTVSHAALMVGAMPVLLAAAAALFAGERLDWIGWLALCASTAGAAMVVLGGDRATTGRETPTLEGDLLVIASLIVALAWILLSKKLMRTHSPPVVTAYTIYSGTAMLVACVLASWLLAPLTHLKVEPMPFAHISLTAWIALAISGLLCTATTTFMWNWGIHHVPASRAGVFLNIEPALGSVLGVELLGERLGPYAWLGGALLLAAAITLTTRGHEPQPAVILE
jgi:drug/metabolite transporter (DMT)-like permease